MTKRIFRSICLVAVAVFLASVALFLCVLYDYFGNVQQNQLKTQTELAAQGVEAVGAEYFEGLSPKGYRVSWISSDGQVLYDSEADSSEMENHLAREEIGEALESGYGESARYSATLMERTLYSAKRLSDGTVVRLSVAQHTLLTLLLGMTQPILIIIVIAIGISFWLAHRLSQNITAPLNQLNLDDPLNNEGYDELSPLLRRIDAQQHQIRKQEKELRQKQEEFEAVTENMAEGIILLNTKGVILGINRAAGSLFGTGRNSIGKYILSVNRNIELSELLSGIESGVRTEKIIDLNGGKYQLALNPVRESGNVSGAVLLLLDVTEKEQAEQLRREFTANVSHELKTPLHTIAGCAELLENGMVRPEDTARFHSQIRGEAGRMIALVEDIIRLSHLDEGAEDMKRERVDLYELAAGTVASLSREAESAGVSVSVEGENTDVFDSARGENADVSAGVRGEKADGSDSIKGESAVVYGIPQLLESIVYNLTDNAIKYNRQGGTVKVSVERLSDGVRLSVADTGIGISPEHRERIFERFYRVDKSRSKELGGTGLGLSIVKHAARLHNAKIELQSAEGEGTIITVVFPAAKE